MENYEQQPFRDVAIIEDPEEPKCACLLVLDTSYSMEGEPIAQLNKGLKQFTIELNNDNLARKRVEVGIVTFGSTVSSEDFVSARDFRPPTLTANGATPMGEAVVRALDMLEARKAVYKQFGPYYRPWIFLITDGAPTDSDGNYWREAVRRVRDGEPPSGKSFLFFSVGVAGADYTYLQALSKRQPLELKGLKFGSLFTWLSASLRSVSRSRPEEEVDLPSPMDWGRIPT